MASTGSGKLMGMCLASLAFNKRSKNIQGIFFRHTKRQVFKHG